MEKRWRVVAGWRKGHPWFSSEQSLWRQKADPRDPQHTALVSVLTLFFIFFVDLGDVTSLS